MKILVTGGAGFIGSNIVDGLISKGYDVVVVDNLSTGNMKNINVASRFYKTDIRDEAISGIFEAEKPDCVIHHAAQIDIQKSIADPYFDAVTNICGTVNILECCRLYGVKKIIYASSAAVYGTPEYLPVDEEHRVDPISFYGISKHTPEHYIKVYNELYGISYAILRYANVYGIRQDPKGEGGVISIFLDRLLQEKAVTIFGDGEQTRDFVYVEDIVAANIAAITAKDSGIYNISTNKAVTVNELYRVLCRILGISLDANYGSKRKGDIVHSCLDNGKAKKFLNWEPGFDIEKGLEKTVQYYRDRYKNFK